MYLKFPVLPRGFAVPLTNELMTDNEIPLLTDTGVSIWVNFPLETRYTNPDLHRRIDSEAQPQPGVDYVFVKYDEEGNPYPQEVQVGVLDSMNSYRVVQTFVHDEDSETCEIP